MYADQSKPMASESTRQRLQRIASTDRKIKRELFIRGEDFSFWMYPLSIAEQQTAQKLSKSTDATDYALQLLVRKAMDENGTPMFTVGDLPFLRNSVEKDVVDQMLLKLIEKEEEEEILPDSKSTEARLQKGK